MTTLASRELPKMKAESDRISLDVRVLLAQLGLLDRWEMSQAPLDVPPRG